MTGFDGLLERAVCRGDVPYAAAAVGDRDGVRWAGAAGIAPDAVFRLFSLTKPVGTVAAMILVERGALALDTEVAAVLPEFGALHVLERLTPAGAVTRPPRTPVTLRHLLTHTSGLSTGTFDRRQAEWHGITGAPGILAGTRAAMRYPLQFEPGAAWSYGIGVDWAGRMVEAVDGRPVDRFVTEEVLGPLGMAHTVFEPCGALAPMLARGPHGFVPAEMAPPARPEVYGMGAALHGTAGDYLRLLRMFLRGGELDGRRILAESTVELMGRNHIGALSVPLLRSTLPAVSHDVDLFPGIRSTWSLGFQRVEADVPDRRRAGSLGWAGIANTHAWLDPAAGVAGVFMTQLLPFLDPAAMTTVDEFERAAYRAR
jgi:methyl acetate hydrolase